MEITANITKLCNNYCKHCYLPAVLYHEGMDDDLPKKVFEKGLKNLSEQFGEQVHQIKISGGEFLMLSYGTEIVSAFRYYFPKAKLIAYTNGRIFLKKPYLFDIVKPDIFHIGMDNWHGTIDRSGYSKTLEQFIDMQQKNKDFSIDVHWAESPKKDDRKSFQQFRDKYEKRDADIQFHYSLLGTHRGRAKEYEDYNSIIKQRTKCTVADSITILSDGNVYACHWGLKDNLIGKMTSKQLYDEYLRLKSTNFYKVMTGPKVDDFINSLLKNDQKGKTFVTCNECEMLEQCNINLYEEADKYVCNE